MAPDRNVKQRHPTVDAVGKQTHFCHVDLSEDGGGLVLANGRESVGPRAELVVVLGAIVPCMAPVGGRRDGGIAQNAGRGCAAALTPPYSSYPS